MRFCNNKIMLLWVKTRILTFLDLGGRGGKSSTGTTRHVTASQNWVVHSSNNRRTLPQKLPKNVGQEDAVAVVLESV